MIEFTISFKDNLDPFILRNFKYENMWRREPSYVRLAKDTWGDVSSIQDMQQLHSSLGRMRLSFLEEMARSEMAQGDQAMRVHGPPIAA